MDGRFFLTADSTDFGSTNAVSLLTLINLITQIKMAVTLILTG